MTEFLRDAQREALEGVAAALEAAGRESEARRVRACETPGESQDVLVEVRAATSGDGPVRTALLAAVRVGCVTREGWGPRFNSTNEADRWAAAEGEARRVDETRAAQAKRSGHKLP